MEFIDVFFRKIKFICYVLLDLLRFFKPFFILAEKKLIRIKSQRYFALFPIPIISRQEIP